MSRKPQTALADAKPTPPPVMSEGSLFYQNRLPVDAVKILAEFDEVLNSTHPLNSRQRAKLPDTIRELSHTLTDERDRRRLGYMNRTETLSAYTHYFMWWNLIRLTKLFVNLSPALFDLNDGDICIDLGSGPLTVVCALFLACPELRQKKLTWYCVDISNQALTLGENIFYTIASRLKTPAWTIIRVKGELGTAIKQKAKLLTCANLFNEVLQKETMPPDYLAKKYCEKLLAYTQPKDFSLLLIEPGVPASARFISLIRDSFMRKGALPVSPCTHTGPCPMDAKKGGKWCNFAFTTEDAPKALKKLSDAAHLSKERAVLSFVAVKEGILAKQKDVTDKVLTFRIASDKIMLPGKRQGFYACSNFGLILAVTETELKSGECYSVTLKNPSGLAKDAKSGALILNLD